MAHLIKPKNKPQKWLLKKKADVLFINKINTLSFQKNKTKQIALINSQLMESKNILRQFYLNKSTLVKAGIERGSRRITANVIKEVLLELAYFKISLKDEWLAINALASKIAANILNANIEMDTALSLDHAEYTLNKSLTVHLYINESSLVFFNEKYKKFAQIFGQAEFFIAQEHDKRAQICVTALDSSFFLEFDEADIDGILNNALRRLNKLLR